MFVVRIIADKNPRPTTKRFLASKMARDAMTLLGIEQTNGTSLAQPSLKCRERRMPAQRSTP